MLLRTPPPVALAVEDSFSWPIATASFERPVCGGILVLTSRVCGGTLVLANRVCGGILVLASRVCGGLLLVGGHTPKAFEAKAASPTGDVPAMKAAARRDIKR